MTENLTISNCPSAATELFDNYGRTITYLRLSITDRCNLRCRYCRPEKGIPFIPHAEILSFEELERLTAVFCAMGVNKVRVTGGEPFARKGCVPFLQRLKEVKGIHSLHITTNGVETAHYLDALAELGIASINLSIDTLDQQRFWRITRRDHLEEVIWTLHEIIARQIPLKINSVVLADTTDEEIVELADLAREYLLTLRFIEKMPFAGIIRTKKLVSDNLLRRIGRIFPFMKEYPQKQPTTARIFSLPGFKGKIGIIQGYSRLFCSTCNKVRITPTGMLKTCLYDDGVLDLKKMLRQDASDKEIKAAVKECVRNRCANGHEAEHHAHRIKEPSMASIGG